MALNGVLDRANFGSHNCRWWWYFQSIHLGPPSKLLQAGECHLMMRKLPVLSFLVVGCAVLFAVPAGAGVVYDNGPAGGTNSAYGIMTGAGVFDSFYVASPTVLLSLKFAAWIDVGNTFQSVDVSIFTDPTSPNFIFSDIVQPVEGNCSFDPFNNQYCTETVQFLSNSSTLSPGTYWLQLANAYATFGTIQTSVGWDINNGVGCTSQNCPSQAIDETGKPAASNSFTLYDGVGVNPTPEPASLLLLTSGVGAAVASLRRRRA